MVKMLCTFQLECLHSEIYSRALTVECYYPTVLRDGVVGTRVPTGWARHHKR